MEREEVYYAIDTEREYQDAKWGSILEHPHEVGAWLTILRAKLLAAESEWSSSNGDRLALVEIRKVAAVAVACCEQHGILTRSRWEDIPEKRKQR